MENDNQNQPTSQRSAQPTSVKKWYQHTSLIVTIILAVLIVSASWVHFNFEQPKNLTPIVSIPNNTNVVVTTTPPDLNYLVTNGQNPQPTQTSTGTPYNYIDDSFSLEKCKNPLPVMASKSGQLQWSEPQYLPNVQIFATSTFQTDYVGGEASYLVGKILTGKYQGGNLLLTTVPYAGMSGSEAYDHIISLDGKYYFLTKYSEDKLGGDNPEVTPLPNVIMDNNLDLTDLDIPQDFQINNPAADFSQLPNFFGFSQYADQPFCADNMVFYFNNPAVGDIYIITTSTRSILDSTTTPTSFYVKSPDSTQRVYVLNPEILGQNDIPLVSWNDIGKNKEKYTYQNQTACGPLAFTDIADVKLSSLIQKGTSFNGQTIYEYKDPQDPGLKDIYDNMGVYNGAIKPPYQSFLSHHPVFFWKDPFGFFVRFINENYERSAYCG